jgi:hypothetical protein
VWLVLGLVGMLYVDQTPLPLGVTGYARPQESHPPTEDLRNAALGPT